MDQVTLMAKGYIDLPALRDRVRRVALEAALDAGMERAAVDVEVTGGLTPRIVIRIESGANMRVSGPKDTDN